MAIIRKLRRVGHSIGLIVPQPVLELLGWNLDTFIEVKVDGKKLILSAANGTTEEPKKKPRRSPD